MFYSIRHVNLFRYNAPVRESVMEIADAAALEGRRPFGASKSLPIRALSSMPIPITWATPYIISTCCASMRNCGSKPRRWWELGVFPDNAG